MDNGFKFLDLVKVVKKSVILDLSPQIQLAPATEALIDFYEGCMGRIVGRVSGQTWSVWFPIPGMDDGKPMIINFAPDNLELVARPRPEEFNSINYLHPVDR